MCRPISTICLSSPACSPYLNDASPVAPRPACLAGGLPVLEGRPGDGGAVAGGLGVARVVEQTVHPRRQVAHLAPGDVLAQRVAESVVELGAQPSQRLHDVLGQGPTHPAPQDGTELLLGVQAPPMVDAVHVAVDAREDVPALAVGV